MSQNVEERKKCNRELAAEDGCLNSAFTLNKWFVKVRPCYGIGKVCFSFVLKTQKAEEKGKISFDVYMDMDEFDNWCDDILDCTMAKQIALERKNSADKPFYTFTTGENGSYKMSFGFSTVSDVNICGKGKHKESGKPVGNYLTANVPVNYSWLRTLAKYYRRTSAAWFAKISDIILSASQKKANSLNDNYSDESNTFDHMDAQESQTEEKESAAREVPKETETSQNGANTQPQKADESSSNNSEPVLKKTTLYTIGAFKERTSHRGDYSLQATEKPLVNGKVADNAHVYNVVVKHDAVKQIGNAWIDLAESAKKNSVKILIRYTTGAEEIKGKSYNVVYAQELSF